MEGTPRASEWDDYTFARVLERVATDGTIDAAGKRINSERLQRIREAAPRDPDRPGRSLLKDAKFSGAIFDSATPFDETTFGGVIDFSRATFSGDAYFGKATFGADARFDGATFGARSQLRDYARFESAIFRSEAHFPRLTSIGWARFRDAIFEGFAHFPDTEIGVTQSFAERTLRQVSVWAPP